MRFLAFQRMAKNTENLITGPGFMYVFRRLFLAFLLGGGESLFSEGLITGVNFAFNLKMGWA